MAGDNSVLNTNISQGAQGPQGNTGSATGSSPGGQTITNLLNSTPQPTMRPITEGFSLADGLTKINGGE